jgi:hypothetical protein
MTQEPASLSKEDDDGRNGPEAKVEKVEKPTTQTPKPAQRPEPTRYGDWEKDGRCIDF